MNQSLREKIKFWLCEKLGHKHNIDFARYHNERVVCPCDRCGRIIVAGE